MKKILSPKKPISPSEKAKKIIRDSVSVLMVGPMLKPISRGKIPLPEGIPCFLIDGGKNFFKGKSASVLTLGDNDSSKTPLDIVLPTKKDFSDFAFALKLLPPSVKILILRGFLGGRRDHELFNMGETHHFLKSRKETMAFFDEQIIAISTGSYEIELQGQFSIACLEKTKIHLSGDCDYQAKEIIFFPLSSLGLSNFSHGKIKIKTTKPIFILLGSSK